MPLVLEPMVKFVHFLFLKDVLPALLSINGSVYDFCRGFVAGLRPTSAANSASFGGQLQQGSRRKKKCRPPHERQQQRSTESPFAPSRRKFEEETKRHIHE
nr:uncharacterized protein LOC109733403 [Aegilops tauschii subsp. strangulata]